PRTVVAWSREDTSTKGRGRKVTRENAARLDFNVISSSAPPSSASKTILGRRRRARVRRSSTVTALSIFTPTVPPSRPGIGRTTCRHTPLRQLGYVDQVSRYMTDGHGDIGTIVAQSSIRVTMTS